MASIEKRPRHDGRASWRAHYRTPSGEQRNKTFDRKAEAERFLANVESSKTTGSFVDPMLARITVGDWATHWLDNQTHLKASTHERYAGIIREHVRPKWDLVKLSNVSHADVQKWVTALSKTPPTRSTPLDPRLPDPPPLLPMLKILLPKCCQTPMWSTWPPTRQKVKPQVRRQIWLAPPARFELALPPPEGESGAVDQRWQSLNMRSD
jgi:hypothetical protein